MGILSDTRGRKQMVHILVKHYTKICVLCYLAGIIWFCALSDSSLNGRTYFSENALLPGQVQLEYYKQKAASQLFSELENMDDDDKQRIPTKWVTRKMTEIGLQAYQQNFTVQIPLPGPNDPSFVEGTNVYGVLRAPRIAGTEAVVLSVPYRHGKNMGALALMLSLADHFRSKSYWSKDIIFLVTEEAGLGMQAWLEAYHGVSNPYIKTLPLEGHSGSIQAAINLEISTRNVDRFDILIEGINGQLPNLDLINMVERLCYREGINSALHTQGFHPGYSHLHSPTHELVSMVMMMFHQASGFPSANHGLFHRYRIEAVTLRGVKQSSRSDQGFADMGRVLEGIFRSLNNLMERFHQSFFFYLLPAPYRYVSIDLYMPPFCCMLLGPLISAVVFWALAGDPSIASPPATKHDEKDDKEIEGDKAGKKGTGEKDEKCGIMKTDKPTKAIDEASLREKVAFAWNPPQVSGVIPVVMTTYLGGALLYYSPDLGRRLSVTMKTDVLTMTLVSLGCFFGLITITPLLQRFCSPRSSMTDLYLVKCVALVLSSATFTSLAAMNFSLAFLVAVLTIPAYLYVGPTQSSLRRVSQVLLLLLASPPAVLFLLCLAYNTILAGHDVDPGLIATVTMDTVYKAIVSALRDSHHLGSWSFGIACLGLMPNWTLFWYLAWK